MGEDVEVKKLEKNVQIYKTYRMFAYDWLFYYAISILFLTTVKEFSMSQVLYLTSIYTFSSLIWQMPVNMLIDKLGLKKSMVIGNLLNALSAAGIIFSNSFTFIAISNVICSLGFALKNISEYSLIYSTLKKLGRRNQFSKITGSADSKYFFLDAICSILAGYMFLINGYLPLIWSFAGLLIAFVDSLEFYDVKPDNDEESNKEFNVADFADKFKKVLKSHRFRSLLAFSCIFTGIIDMTGNLYKAILIDFNVTANNLALIVCIFTALSGIGAKLVYYIEKRTKNRTLTILSLTYVFSLLTIGLQDIDKFASNYSFLIICICLVLIAIIQGAYRIINKKYIISFTHTDFRNNAVTLYYLFQNIGSTILCFVSGLLLESNSNGNSTVIMAMISLILIIIILSIMRKRVGLRPEQYSKTELYGSELEKEEVKGKV